MDTSVNYEYKLRPGYGSDKLLIEFFTDTGDKKLEKALIEAIGTMNPEQVGVEDIWMNDEVLYWFESTHGKFNISKDVWGFQFIMAENNQEAILEINRLLVMDKRFQKIEVDFNDYRKPKPTHN